MTTSTKTITATGTMLDAFKRWPAKLAGAKPTQADVDATAALLKRTGTGKHLALAMYMRADGATQPETVAACGDTNVNAYYEAVRSKALVARTLPARNGHKVYALALPTKRASKAKGKAKAKRAAKVAPVDGGNADGAGNAS